MARDRERELDEALHSRRPVGDPELTELADAAGRLSRALAAEPPEAGHQRALFVNAVAARRRHGLTVTRVALPALATVAVLALLAAFGRATLPGDPLYPVRSVLGNAGIVRSPLEEVDDLVAAAELSIERGERSANDRPGAAAQAAIEALEDLGEARDIAIEVRAGERLETIAELQEDAIGLLVDAREEASEQARHDDDGGGDGDRSGSGGDDDSSGSGSGGGDDSGSGSGPSG